MHNIEQIDRNEASFFLSLRVSLLLLCVVVVVAGDDAVKRECVRVRQSCEYICVCLKPVCILLLVNHSADSSN